jgi:hypothetical protein
MRFAVAPALAAAASRAGWIFDCYYDALRAGRHFGGPTAEDVSDGYAAGSTFAGGEHEAKLLWLASRFRITAVGDPASSLLAALDVAGAEPLVLTTEPSRIYGAAFELLGTAVPHRLIVLDGKPQGPSGLVTAPYLYPAFFADGPAMGVDVSVGEEEVANLERLGIDTIEAIGVEASRAAMFPRSLQGTAAHTNYESLTTAFAEQWRTWGTGVLLGDPQLVASQLPKAARLRLLPLYGRPQVDALRRARFAVEHGSEPVYGRQYDDRDFFEVARLGHGLQLVDPSPPFDSSAVLPQAVPASVPAGDLEPDDETLAGWAAEGRVLVTLVFWAGMIRELDCWGPVFDLVTETGLRAGLVVTAESLEHSGGTPLSLLSVPRERGGVRGLVEPLLGSTGRGVAAESLLPGGALRTMLTEARAASATLLPTELVPRGWWPLMDAPLVPRRTGPIERRRGRPALVVAPRAREANRPAPGSRSSSRDLRDLAGSAIRALHLEEFVSRRRPYDRVRPGSIDRRIATEVQAAGFSYMWTKTSFGECSPRLFGDEFVTLPFTAGDWDGWSPFYTIADAAQLRRAERRLLRRRHPGWLASTVDSPLWFLPGELRQHGRHMQQLATIAANGGSSGRLVNVTPNVVARYARILLRRGARTLNGTGPADG